MFILTWLPAGPKITCFFVLNAELKAVALSAVSLPIRLLDSSTVEFC